MTKNCIIVDDEQTARNILKAYISDVSFLKLINEFKNALEALEFIKHNNIDIIFIDIEMPKLSGLNFVKIIDSNAQIIFTTAHREFALDGFELNAIDYLLKPFSFDRFLKAVQKTIPKTTLNMPLSNSIKTSDHIYVKVNKQMIKVYFKTLLYIEGLSNYVKLYTNNGSLVVYDKLSSLIDDLPSNEFMRVHKSYIINTSKIELYTNEYVEIDNKHIPVSNTYRKALISFLSQN